MLTSMGCSSAEDAATTTTTQKTTTQATKNEASATKTNKAPDMDLLTAIDKQNILVITQHMDAGTDPDYVPIPEGMPFEGAHPLHLAVLKGDIDILSILLDHGADINIAAKNADEASPLSWAAFFLVEGAAAFLVKSGADVNFVDANGLTPLDASNLAWLLSAADTEKQAIAERIIGLLKESGALTSGELS